MGGGDAAWSSSWKMTGLVEVGRKSKIALKFESLTSDLRSKLAFFFLLQITSLRMCDKIK